MKYLFSLLFLAAFFTGSVVFSQQVDKSFYFDYGEKFYYDIVNVPSPHPDSTRFHIFFRMRNDLLAFRAVNGHYEAMPLLYVEFIDSTGIIRMSREWRDTVIAAAYEETQSKSRFVRDALTIDLPTGVYNVLFESGDVTAPRTNRFKAGNVTGRTFVAASKTVAPPLFVEPVRTDVYRPFILKGDVAFPSDIRALISVSDAVPGDQYEYIVKQAPGAEKDLHPDDPLLAFTSVMGTVTPEIGSTPVVAKESLSVFVRKEKFEEPEQMAVTGSQAQQQQAAPGIGLLDILLPSGTMPSGRYMLQIYKKGKTDTLSHPFALVWENKPLSLRNIQYAVELGYYVMTDDEYDRVNSGSLESKRQKLYAFWRERDPVPTTVFNEAMAEYYTRVDYAYFNYQTLAERDGARTERGKIYILHGPATSIERRLEPNKPAVEVWRYDNNVAKEFLFESPAPGIFVLKGIQEL